MPPVAAAGDPRRAVWVDAGNDANYTKLAAAGIGAAYFDIRDPRLTTPYLEGVVAHGLEVGVYAVASWYPQLGPAAFADTVSGMLGVIAPGSAPDFPAVCLDIEVPALPVYARAALRQWRKHRAKRVTDLTIEGHKGGLFSPSDVTLLTAWVRWVVPQCYDGSMRQTWDSAAMLRNLTDAGFPVASVYPFLDAAHLGEWWQGYAFTQGRLP